MIYNREKLIEIARPYFKDDSVKKMYVVEDGNLFYENAKSYATAHAKRLDVKLYTITRDDFVKKTVVVKNDEPKEKSLREQAKKLGLTIPGRASDETIQKMIDDHKSESKAE